MAEIEIKQKSNWIRSCKDWCGLLDCKWDLIWFHNQFTFLFQSQAFLLTFFSRDPYILRPFHGLSAKQRNPIRGRPKQVCSTCTWRLLFIAILPNFSFSSKFGCWFISLSSETCLTNSIFFFPLNWHCELDRVRIYTADHNILTAKVAKHLDFRLRE